jgi:hypothetical protein
MGLFDKGVVKKAIRTHATGSNISKALGGLFGGLYELSKGGGINEIINAGKKGAGHGEELYNIGKKLVPSSSNNRAFLT